MIVKGANEKRDKSFHDWGKRGERKRQLGRRGGEDVTTWGEIQTGVHTGKRHNGGEKRGTWKWGCTGKTKR